MELSPFQITSGNVCLHVLFYLALKKTAIHSFLSLHHSQAQNRLSLSVLLALNVFVDIPIWALPKCIHVHVPVFVCNLLGAQCMRDSVKSELSTQM